jgi:predicted dehydrogenase
VTTVAVIGTGGIAGIHAADLATLGERARIIAAVEPDPLRLEEFCATWDVPFGFTDLTSMLDTAPPELVIVCTPPHLHAASAVACLARGVHVWCEKPVATSLAEFDAMTAAHQDALKAQTPEEQAARQKFQTEGVISSEMNHFKLDPVQSYVSKETRAKDPAFWSAK